MAAIKKITATVETTDGIQVQFWLELDENNEVQGKYFPLENSDRNKAYDVFAAILETLDHDGFFETEGN